MASSRVLVVEDDPSVRGLLQTILEDEALEVILAAGVAAWPAVLDALATARVELDPDRVGVRFGPVTVVAGGQAAPHDERAAAAVVAKSQVDLAVDLGVGPAAATVTTTDLPPEALGRHTG